MVPKFDPANWSRNARLFGLSFLTLAISSIVTFTPGFCSSAQAQDAEELTQVFKSLRDWVETAKDADNTMRQKIDEIASLQVSIDQLLHDPDALNHPEQYGEVFVKIVMLIPDTLQFDPETKKAIRAPAELIRKAIEASFGVALDPVRRAFDNRMALYAGDTSLSDTQKAWKASEVGGTQQVRLWLMLNWIDARDDAIVGYDTYPWNGHWRDSNGDILSVGFENGKVIATYFSVRETNALNYWIIENQTGRFSGTVQPRSFDITYVVRWSAKVRDRCHLPQEAPETNVAVQGLRYVETDSRKMIVMSVPQMRMSAACKLVDDGLGVMVLERVP